MTEEPRRRSEDRGWITRAWDWIDDRQVDKHFVSVAVLYGTIKITAWSMNYAETHTEDSGVQAAAIIAAVSAPYMALQAAVVAFYFKART